ncbi:hypothetical protein AX15_004633 [Amanita polypyramis BW_CC]|nr:hypothetical protein AX15_004633 [Amanita polypyramis BW_CC]
MKSKTAQQAVPVPVPEPHALIPLTVFDRLYYRTTFVMGWLVEGRIDEAALEGALTRLMRRWRILAGRIESFNDKEKHWRVRVPIADIPSNYPTFALTSTVSEIPLSRYIPRLDEIEELTPFRLGSSDSTLHHLFAHPSTPLGYAAFEARVHPLTCWHVAHFPASLSRRGRAYTCIGFSRCGIFDDQGASMILRALAAEMSGTPWRVPPIPNWGVNDNPLQRALDRESNKYQIPLPGDKEYAGFLVLGIVQACKMICSRIWQKVFKGAEPRMHSVRRNLVRDIVEGTRHELREKGYINIPVTDSEIFFAWIISTLYESKIKVLLRGTKDKKIHINTFASFRSFFRSPDYEEPLDTYLFNASIPLPCPTITYEEACIFSVANLARMLAIWRSTFSRTHVLTAYEMLSKSARTYPFNPAADETLTLADVSTHRFAEMDWPRIGARLTLGMARFHATPDDFVWTNTVCIIGRLPDGSVLLDSILGGMPLSRLESKVMHLQAEKVSQGGAVQDGPRQQGHAPDRMVEAAG